MRTPWLFQRATLVWFGLALIVRGALFWVFLQEHGFHYSLYGWGVEGGDTPSYFTPIDSLINGNGYQPDLRMPGYGLIYLLLRLVTTEPGSGLVIIFLQLFLGALSCVALKNIAEMVGLGQRWQRLTFWLSLLCPQLAFLDVQLVTESFCTSALIFSIFHVAAHFKRPSNASMIAAGIWLTWAIFMRPVYSIALPLLAVGLLVRNPGHTKRSMQYALCFLLPFIVFDSAWTWRNWAVRQQFRPLANSVYYPEFKEAPTYAIFQYLQAYGGNQAWWDPRADIRWFNVREGEMGRRGRLVDDNVELSPVAFSERCTRDSLLALANDMAQWSDSATSAADRRVINSRAIARSQRLVHYFREDRPVIYHVWSRIRLLGLQLRRAGLNDLFETHFRGDPFFAPAIIAINDAWYWIIMPLGSFGALRFIRKRKAANPVMAVIAIFLVASLLVHPFVFRMCEGRYIVCMYPFLLLMAMAFLHDVGGSVRGSNLSARSVY